MSFQVSITKDTPISSHRSQFMQQKSFTLHGPSVSMFDGPVGTPWSLAMRQFGVGLELVGTGGFHWWQGEEG